MTSYCCIILAGWMIGLPFILVLIFSLFEFGTTAQFTAILAFIGFFLLYFPPKHNSIRQVAILQVLIYFLLLAPIIERLLVVPLQLFNYPLFIVPTVIFIIGFPISIVLLLKS